MVLHFHRQSLFATVRSCHWWLSHILLEVLNLQTSHPVSCHVRAAGYNRDQATWFQPTNCEGMCKQWDVTKILTDYNFFKEGVNFTGGATA